jgi:DNA-binding CsgD family transcriptional regulator
MPSEAWLLIHGVSHTRWAHQILHQPQTLGRAAKCDVHVPHKSISRLHAEIWRKNGTIYVRDLNSMNGTFVDDTRVDEAELTVGNVLRLGSVNFDVVSHPAELEEKLMIEVDDTCGCGGGEIALRAREQCRMLTFSQQQVLRMLLQGLSEKQVAAELSISRQTVHTHVKDIYRVLQVHSRAELLALFISQTVETPWPGKE